MGVVALPLSCFLERTNTSNISDMNEHRNLCEPWLPWHSELTALRVLFPLCSSEGRWPLAALCSTLEQWSSENTAYTKHPPEITVRGTAWETLISSFFWALSQQQNSISPGFLWQHLQKSFPFGSLFPLEGCSHWHSGKDTLGPAPWHVELWECCHCHCVSRNVIMAEQSNYLPPLLSPLITLY